MGLSIGMGGDVGYYERGADEDHVRDEPDHDLHAQRERASDYYTGDVKAGRELDGRWTGAGAEALGLHGNVTSWQLHKLYGEHIDPVTGVELGNRPRKYKTPEDRLAARLAKEPFATAERRREIELSVSPRTPHSRNFFDLTWSLPKSYSVLYAALIAAGREDDAQKLIDAHHRAIAECMKIAKTEGGESRIGHHGRKVAGVSTGERIRIADFVYSMFDHRVSRSGDPQLHTHLLLLNKALCTDGKWRAIDSDVIVRQLQRSLGALHERFMAEETVRTMGLRHRERVDGFGWEVEGITAADMELYSTRRRAIDTEAAEMTARFVAKFNREPNGRERDAITQAATLVTRPNKAHDMTFEQYVEAWMERFAAERGEHLASVLDRVPMGEGRELPPRQTWDRGELLEIAVARCEARSATWTRPQLRQALSDILPPNLGRGSADELLPYLDGLVDEAIRSERVVTLSQPPAVEAPTSLRHDNGHSIYEPFHTERFTTARRLRNEGGLAGLAQRTDGPRLTDRDAQRLIMETTLYPDQAQVVRDVLTSGRRLTFLEAKAGTGKSFTIGQVAKLWSFGVGGKVIGLAKSQAATGVLIDEGLDHAYNFDRFKMALDNLGPDTNPKAAATIRERYGLGPQSLLIVDEISTLEDAERFWLEQYAREHQVTMFWVGDRGQVGAVGADAALGVLADAVAPLELDVARRFTNEWEGPASLDLHDGKTSAIIAYDDHGRIVTGTREEMNKAAVDLLVADLVEGHNALLMVPSVELATEFSSEVRQRLIDLDRIDPSQSLPLRDDTRVSPGDVVQARETMRQIPGGMPGESISNRDIFHVKEVGVDGSLTVRQHIGHDGGPVLGAERVIPAIYVRDFVELGYVTTVHSKIGRTVERGYELVTDASTWNGVYTGATRGKDTNVILVPVEHDADGQRTETGVEVLARIAERAGETELSATKAQRQELDAVTHLGRLGPIYENELARHATERQREAFERAFGSGWSAVLDDDPATAALYRLTRALENEGHDVDALLAAAREKGELGTARSVAEVLHSRIGDLAGPVAPAEPRSFRFVDAVPAGDAPELRYLRDVAAHMDARTDYLADSQMLAPEPWATKYLGPVPDDPVARLDWTAKAGQVAAYREQYGITDAHNAIGEAPGRKAAEQRASWERAYAAIGQPAENEDVARRSDGELLLAVDQYRRIEEWMPPEVGERLRTAAIAQRDYQTTAALDRAAGNEAQAARAEALAARLAKSVAKLEVVAEARRVAEERFAAEREAANAAARELARRRSDDHEQTTDEPGPGRRDIDEIEHRSFTLDDAVERARQVTRELEAEREIEEQRQLEAQAHEHSTDPQHGYGYEH